MKEDDLAEWGLSNKDMDTLLDAKNASGQKYKYEYLPLSKEKVALENGKLSIIRDRISIIILGIQLY